MPEIVLVRVLTGEPGSLGERRLTHTTGLAQGLQPSAELAGRQTFRLIGWPLFRVARYVEWYGHGQELIPVPDEGVWVRLVPIIGTAR